MRFKAKYPELQDKNWLYQKYEVEQLGTTEISKLVGCERSSVLVAMKRHNIKRRDCKAARKLVPLQSFKYDLLNDKEWLYQKYIVEGLATEEITELAGAKTANSARQALIRFNIPVRNLSDGLTYKRRIGVGSSYVRPLCSSYTRDDLDDNFVLNDYTLQVIEGGLLGDATMRIWNPSSNQSYPTFKRKNKFYDHVKWVAEQICGVGSENRVKESISKCSNGKLFPAFSYNTFTHKELLPIYQRWYPAENNFVKLVPQDFALTSISLLHWFLDDGYCCWRNRKYPAHWQQRVKQVVAGFCSESFSYKDNARLCDQFASLGIKAVVTHYPHGGTGWRIKIYQSSVRTFFDVIGPCPVPSLAYKWKLPGDAYVTRNK